MTLDNESDAFERVADNRQELAQALASDVASALSEAISLHGDASLIVSGGSTPQPFLKALAEHKLPWSKLTVSLVDERWVDAHHADSNERFVRENLLSATVGQAKFVSLKNGAATAQQGWDDCETVVASMRRPFDVLVLGMGADGHTASLFADDPASTQALKKACGKLTWPTRPPQAAHDRISLTLDAILDSKRLLLHITGSDKREIFRSAKTNADSGYPIGVVIREAASRLGVYWSP